MGIAHNNNFASKKQKMIIGLKRADHASDILNQTKGSTSMNFFKLQP
jgi:hypothetical protein